MSVLDRVAPGTLTRELKTRAAAKAYPLAHRLRARIPRYSPSEQASEFHRRAEERGLGDLRLLYWYHTVDLGRGLVTPGTFDYRASVTQFHFPDDMNGMTVLDVGSATGFFAFEFEKRGAQVVSVDVPSLADVDRLPGESVEQTRRKIAKMTARHSTYTRDEFDTVFNASGADFDHYFLDGPFKLCHEVLQSQVERTYSSIYGIPETELGSRSFDLVFLGDLLLHLLHPFQALTAVAPLCRGTLVLSQHLPAGSHSRPEMLYVGGDTPGDDLASWWLPNRACLDQVLRKLGFREIEEVGRNTGVGRGGMYYDRPILHATR
jgi:tRNA (mo5U34)-methyltransferase